MKNSPWVEEFGCHPETVWARLVAEVCQETGADLVYAPKCFDTPDGRKAIDRFQTNTGVFVALVESIPTGREE